MRASDAESLPLVGYVPDRVEVVGRRLKMEYVGMASVFTVIALGIYGGIEPWLTRAAATAATFCLFLGLKKKTRDHLVTSFLMYGAALLALPAVRAGWAIPFFFFGMLFWALEGYLEKRRNRIFALPVVFAPWVLLDPFWPLGLAVIAIYLAHERPDAPRLRRKLLLVFAAALVVAAATWIVVRDVPSETARLPLGARGLALWAGLALPTLVALALYRRELIAPHWANATIFGVSASGDARLLAVFGLAGTVLISATFLRNSADSDRLRPWLKHAEWYYFWIVLAAALFLGARALGAG